MSHRQNHDPWFSRKAWCVVRQQVSGDIAWQKFAADLGHHIHRLRVAKGLSQEAVAYRAGLSRVTYLRYEQGEAQSGAPSNPTLRTLVALSQVFDIPLQDLIPADLPDVTSR